MTDFIRSIFQNAGSANTAATTTTTSTTSSATLIKMEPSSTASVDAATTPVNQIQLPPTAATLSALSTATTVTVDTQRAVKVETVDSAAVTQSATSTVAMVATPPVTSVEAGKAQRAVRRDMVNARRDKRKAMASASATATATASASATTMAVGHSSAASTPAAVVPMAAPTSMATATSAATPMAPAVDDAHGDDKSKKMKTSKTSSVAMAGGLAASTLATTATTTTTTTSRSPSSSLNASFPPTPGLLFTPEIDAAGEERIRAMEAQLETLDPDSKEAKKKRRLIRNRMSAQLHRERKKAYVGQLEDQLLDKDRELKLLQDKLAAMMDESAKLKQKMSATVDAAPSTSVGVEKNVVDVELSTASVVVATPTPSPAMPQPQPLPQSAMAPSTPPMNRAVARPVSSSTSPLAKLPAVKPRTTGDDADATCVIKEEQLPTWTTPWPQDAPADAWAFHHLLAEQEDAMAALDDDASATADLLREFEQYPFADLEAYPELLGTPSSCASSSSCHVAPEMHAAKKNLAMMMAVMFSVSCVGNSPSFYNVTNGSNFSSMFGASPPKEFSQMSIASRIVACLEKTSWKNFRDVSSWISAQTAASAAAASAEANGDEEMEEEDGLMPAVQSPSAASDITDSAGSCASPEVFGDCLAAGELDTDLIDEFVYPVDDPFASATVPDVDWLMQDAEVSVEDHVVTETTKQQQQQETMTATTLLLSEAALNKQAAGLAAPEREVVAAPMASSSSSMTSRLYEKLTTLWREKNQVLLTVHNREREVMQRSVADMSTICEGLQSGNFFTKVFGDDSVSTTIADDQSVTFLYPMSAFADDKPRLMTATATDPMFLEVSCQMNGNGAVAMTM